MYLREELILMKKLNYGYTIYIKSMLFIIIVQCNNFGSVMRKMLHILGLSHACTRPDLMAPGTIPKHIAKYSSMNGKQIYAPALKSYNMI